MSKVPSGLKIGAQDLLDHFKYSPRDIAEAYIKGDIPKHLEPFVWDVISDQQIADARDKLDRTAWRLEERVAKLEEEVRALQANDR